MKDDTKIEIEELLKLKRFERPTEAQWSRFDRDLKQKMLKKIQKKDPLRDRVFNFVFSKRILTTGAFASSMFAAVALVFSISDKGVESATSSENSVSNLRVFHKTELPSVGETFVSSEIAVPSNKDETPLEITIKPNDSSSRFVSSDVPLFVISSF